MFHRLTEEKPDTDPGGLWLITVTEDSLTLCDTHIQHQTECQDGLLSLCSVEI